MAKDSVPRRSSGESRRASSVGGNALPREVETPVAGSWSPREKVVRDIIAGLYEGRYLPGQRLVEARLTESLDISRGPVREGLNRLAAAGIVVLTLQRGAQVRELTRQEAVDILLVVQTLVGLSARLAAERATAAGIASLKSALDRLVRFDPGSVAMDHARARDSFYGELLNLAACAELSRVIPGTQIHLVRVQFREKMRKTDARRHADYRRIAAAVITGQPRAAETAARAHIERAIKALAAAG